MLGLALSCLAGPAGAAGVAIAGQVLGADLAPIAGAAIELRSTAEEPAARSAPEPAATARTDGSGHFLLEAPATGLWTLVAHASGFVPAAAVLIPLLEESRLPPAALKRDAGLRVRVVDAEGRPVAGVRVSGRPTGLSPADGAWGPAPRSAVSGADGAALIPRAEGEVLQVTGTLSSGAAVAAVSTSGQLLLRMPRNPARGAALVADGSFVAVGKIVEIGTGRPIAGALVWGMGGETWTRTAADGSYRLGGAGDRLQAGAPNYRIATFRVGSARRPTVTSLRRAASAVGMVVDPQGRALGNVPVEVAAVAAPAERVRPRDRRPSPIASAPGGGFALYGVAPGVPVELRAQGARLLLAPLAPGEQRAGLRLVVDPRKSPTADRARAKLAGSIRDEAGNPVAGAEVRLEGEAARQPGYRGPVHSAVDGTFELAGLTAGAVVDLAVLHADFAEAQLRGVEVGDGSRLDVVLGHPLRVSGRVVDRGDRGIGGALVLLQVQTVRRFEGEDGRSLRTEVLVDTDEDGAFVADRLPAGALSLRAIAAGYQDAHVDGLELSAEEPLDAVTLRLAQAATLVGKVKDSEGRLLAGARVSVTDVTGDGGSKVAEGTTDDAGDFRIDGLRPGLVAISAEHRAYRRAERRAKLHEGSNGLDLSLESDLWIAGRVEDGDGNPIAAALVTVSGAGIEPKTDTTTADGAFRVSGLGEGRQRLLVEAADFVSGRSDVEIVSAPIEGLELRLARGGAIAGRLRALDPSLLARVEVGARSPTLGDRPGVVAADGRYRVAGLPAGEWTVIAQVTPGAHRAVASARLDPGVPEIEVDLDFGAGLTISGRISSQGTPLADVQVDIVGLGVETGGMTSSDSRGAFAFTGLGKGRYVLTARARDGSAVERTVEAAADLDLQIEIPPAVHQPSPTTAKAAQ